VLEKEDIPLTLNFTYKKKKKDIFNFMIIDGLQTNIGERKRTRKLYPTTHTTKQSQLNML
jgi:hypothetical protein